MKKLNKLLAPKSVVLIKFLGLYSRFCPPNNLIIWVIIFAMIGGYFQSKGWSFLSWIFFGLSGMSVLHILRS